MAIRVLYSAVICQNGRTEPQIFTESVFPKFFGEAAQASYMESSETYKTLFADAAKYNAIMYALGRVLYRDLRQQ